jgi:hypothetical protein
LSLNLKKRKKAGGRRKPKKIEAMTVDPEEQDEAQAVDLEEAGTVVAVSRGLVFRKRSDLECRTQQSRPRNQNPWL